MTRVALSWSSGKDSAWALHLLRQDPSLKVVALVTTFNSAADRVAMHAVRRACVKAQAERAGLPVWAVELPWPCSNAEYEAQMALLYARAQDEGMEAIAFGDLFLEDIRAYRVEQLRGSGLMPLFPVWGLRTDLLAREMIAAGVKAKLTCVDPAKLDAPLLRDLPAGIDPCGENGEFHSFVYEAPVFSRLIAVSSGIVLARDGFVFADVLLNE